MWLNICQGLLVLGWLGRFSIYVVYCAKRREAEEPKGIVGFFLACLWYGLALVIAWRAGAFTTIVGSP
jgi:hypothetical protein